MSANEDQISVSNSSKRSFEEADLGGVGVDNDIDTDSEIEIMPLNRAFGYTVRCMKASARRKPVATGGKAAPASPSPKRRKLAPANPIERPAPAALADEGNEADDEMPARIATTAMEGKTLMAPTMNRKMRMVNPSNTADADLITTAIKANDDIYMSDVENPEPITGTSKPELYKNVVWGPEATDINYPGSVFPRNPVFTQFVPGRWERQPDGTLLDQKSKLLIKLTDKNGQKRIFANPPPKDWSNQEAITALNKRSVQQIRRNTEVRFRQVVKAYVPEERRWILNNLTNGKPQKGWKAFVKDFNAQFAGQTLPGVADVRPERTHSSLTKEVERFGPEFYSKGLIPTGGKAPSKTTNKTSIKKSEKPPIKTSDDISNKTSEKASTKTTGKTNGKTAGKKSKSK